ncbi:hypothetical protein A2U01_0084484, partial [Trifolium medium]|nr:hypothetical protein [Trifolium medium]
HSAMERNLSGSCASRSLVWRGAPLIQADQGILLEVARRAVHSTQGLKLPKHGMNIGGQMRLSTEPSWTAMRRCFMSSMERI